MTSLYSMVERPDLESPVLIMVLKGWIDAGLGADGAADVLREQLDTAPSRASTPTLLDWRARPTMRLVDGVNTQAHLGGDRAVLGQGRPRPRRAAPVGNEPDHAWLAFSEQVVDLAEDLGVPASCSVSARTPPPCPTRAARCWPRRHRARSSPGAAPELRGGPVRACRG